MSPTRQAVLALALAAALVLAGCAGSLGGSTNGPDAEPVGSTPANADVSDGGTIEFYISDEENAIDDFEHLNVTITMIGLHRVGDAGEDATEEPTGTTTEAPGTATATVESTATESPAPTGTATDASPTAEAEAEKDEAEDGEEKEDDEGEGDSQWVEYEVNRTVDLTELKGANATKLGVLAASDGDYDKVFVYVSSIDATLKNGESVRVKLPSNKLQINKRFTVGNGQNVSFVFDLAVHKAGNSGKYILQPVISESGTGDEVEIDDVDEADEDESDEADDAEQDDEEEEEETEEPEATEAEEEAADDEGESNPALGRLLT